MDECKAKALKLWRHWYSLTYGANEDNPHVIAITTCIKELEIYFNITQQDKDTIQLRPFNFKKITE